MTDPTYTIQGLQARVNELDQKLRGLARALLVTDKLREQYQTLAESFAAAAGKPVIGPKPTPNPYISVAEQILRRD